MNAKLKIISGTPEDVQLAYNNWRLTIKKERQIYAVRNSVNVVNDQVVVTLVIFTEVL